MNRHRLGIVCSRGSVPVAIALLAACGALLLWCSRPSRLLVADQAGNASQSQSSQVFTKPAGTVDVVAAYAHLPLIFEPNQGQSDPRVKFLARGSGYALFLTADQAVLALERSLPSAQHSGLQLSALAMGLVNANPRAQIAGRDELPGKSNYFIGNDPAKWHTNIPQFARVRYSEVYRGIDLVYYGKQGQLEYDFVVAPGSDPKQVALRFQGSENLAVDADGDLLIFLGGEEVRLQSPRVYQKSGGEDRRVAGRFELRGKNEAGFALGAYDHSRELIIDPVLSYSTYLGGTKDEACSVILGTVTPGCPAIAVDTAFNAYLAGSTTSINFPLPSGGAPFQSTLKGTANVFVAKFNNAATILEFATYLGGSGIDTTTGVAVDNGFNVIVAGTTSSTNFPTSSSAFQTAPVRLTNKHVFVSKLDTAGKTLLYSTYLSGTGVDTATGVALDPGENIYVTGTTTSKESQTGFPSTIGAYQVASTAATSQFFLSKLNPTLSGASSVAYSTFFGGSTPTTGETVGGGVAVDINSVAYFTGGTTFTNLPMLNASQGTLAGGVDAFVVKLDPAAIAGAQLIYSTYLGGTGDDIANAIAVDTGLTAYVTGSTTSTDFPVAGTGVFQPSHNPAAGTDAFLAKLASPVTTGTTPGSVTLSYTSYLGGSGSDVGTGIAVDTIGGARITGWTNSVDFPSVNNPVQTSFGGGLSDAFVARIDTTATTSTAPGHYSTYLGGSGNDYGTGIAVDSQGASYVAGETSSTNFPTTLGVFQPNLAGGTDTDAFVTKLGPVLSLALSVTASPSPVGVGSQVSFIYTVTNNGDPANGVTFTDTLPTGGLATFGSATSGLGNCGQANGGTVLCNLGIVNSTQTGSSPTVTVVLTPVAEITPATSSTTLGNSAFVGVSGSSVATASASVVVNDFNLSVAPATATVAAGVPATYTVTVTPTGAGLPATVSIGCSAGLPTGATCTETTNPIPNLNNGAASTVLVINTTARVTTTTRLWEKGGPVYVSWLPISGLALLGAGISRVTRKRRILLGMLLAGFLALVLFQAGCGSKAIVSTTTGTSAGTYVVTVSASSGSAIRTFPVTLVVQ